MLKPFLQDLLLPYKNFFNWVVNKTIFFFFSVFIGFLLAAPFFLIIYLLVKNDNIKWMEILSNYFISGSIPMSFLSVLSDNFGILFLEMVFLVFGIVFFLLGYYYQITLNTRLFLEYQNNIKSHFLSKRIFTIFPGYLKITSLVGFFVSIPFLIFFLIVLILVAISGGILEATNLSIAGINYFTITIFILGSITIIITFYLIYRYLFAITLYLDNELKKEFDNKKTIEIEKNEISGEQIIDVKEEVTQVEILSSNEYLKKSLLITKENKLLFSFIIFILFVLFFIISIFYSLSNYFLESIGITFGLYVIFFIISFIVGKLTNLRSIIFLSFVFLYIVLLDIISIFGGFADKTGDDIIIWIYMIMTFVIFGSIFQMIVVSFYKNYLINNTNK